MQIGIPIGGTWPLDVLLRNVRHAESMGVDYVFLSNRVGPFDRDPLIIATILALNTEMITIAPYSLTPFMYHPVNVCRAIAHIDEIAPGRVVLGWLPGFAMGLMSVGLGAEAQRPMKAVREAVELSKLLLSGHVPPGAITEADVRQEPIPEEYVIDYPGDHFPCMNLVLPSRKVPVMLSSFSPKMLQLGGEIADEVLTGWFANPGGNEWALEQIASGAARAGRSLDDIKLHRAIHMAVWPDRQVARHTIAPISTMVLIAAGPYRKHFGIKLPFEKEAGDAMDPNSELFQTLMNKGLAALLGDLSIIRDIPEIPVETHLQQVVFGTPDDCVEQLQRTVLDPRFDTLDVALFVPPPERENWPKAVDLLMNEVVPALKVPARGGA